MAEKYLLGLAEEIKKLIPGNVDIHEDDDRVNVLAEMDIGIKGVKVNIECTLSTVKVKGARTYKYPIEDASADKFQHEMIEKHPGYAIYANGQLLSFSKFFSYQSLEEALNTIRAALDTLRDAVVVFENDCVNFLEKNVEQSNEEYNPEDNVKIVNVDNSYHAVSTTEQDNKDYEKEHEDFAKKIFKNVAKKINGTINGNEVVAFNKETGTTLRCVLFPLDAEILVSASISASKDVGAMYSAYINANYSDLINAYDAEKEIFTVRTYSIPDKYSPDDTEELLTLCRTAIADCVNEYKHTLERKDSADFAADIQQVLAEQTEQIAERENAITAREDAMRERESELKVREADLEKQLQELAAEKEELEKAANAERERIKEYEAEMQKKIKDYEERNVKDILNIQQLANQVASLQSRQSSIGKVDDDAVEEMRRMESKVRQLTSQKIALEKKLTEKIKNKDSKISALSDVIGKKDSEIKKIKTNIEDMVQSQVSDEVKKSSAHIEDLEKQLAEVGHILTPEDIISYYEQYSDIEAKKFHAPNAEFVVYNDASLEVRIKIGETNYVDVSKEATLKDQILRRLNTKYVDTKFFSKDSRIIARSYFKKNATPEEVDEIIAVLSKNFEK